MSVWMVGIDTGGTFTDLIAFNQATKQIEIAKVASVPNDPSVAVMNALKELMTRNIAPADIAFLAHGTTVATNALLEHKGVRTGLLINKGFRAVYEARGWSQPTGRDLIDTHYRKPPMLVPQKLTAEITGRLDHTGTVITPLDEAEIRDAARQMMQQDIESVAICFLFSFLNPEHEKRAAAIFAEEAPGIRLSLSSYVLPVIREYPRLSTTVIDAYIGPKIENYLRTLSQRLDEFGIETPQRFLMQSNGGLMRISIGARHPNQTLLSGPAAGVIAATAMAKQAASRHVVTFDIGGTSTDISVIVDGRVLETNEGNIAGQDIATPMLKVRTLGAGGGTIAWIGKDGLMKVGPHSAGSVPGPACYARGGELPTVTDANLVLGALSAETPLAGSLRLDRSKAERAVQDKLAAPLGLNLVEAAAGIIRILNARMAVDLRLSLLEQGRDPRQFTLVGFGGAGPLHAAYLARALGISKILIPLYPGINCATGLLQTAVRHSYMQSAGGLLNSVPLKRIDNLFTALESDAYAEAADEGFDRSQIKIERRIEMRYPHQGYTLGVPCPVRTLENGDRFNLKQAFDALHLQVFGQSAPDEEAELTTLRVDSEVIIPVLDPAPPRQREGGLAKAAKGTRSVYDVDQGEFVTAGIFQRELMAAGDRIEGPAIIDQFDSTTLVLGGQSAEIDAAGLIVITEKGHQA